MSDELDDIAVIWLVLLKHRHHCDFTSARRMLDNDKVVKRPQAKPPLARRIVVRKPRRNASEEATPEPDKPPFTCCVCEVKSTPQIRHIRAFNCTLIMCNACGMRARRANCKLQRVPGRDGRYQIISHGLRGRVVYPNLN